MDNHKSHYANVAKERMNELGITRLFLPPYCPEMNPIEKLWAQIKNEWRKELLLF